MSLLSSGAVVAASTRGGEREQKARGAKGASAATAQRAGERASKKALFCNESDELARNRVVLRTHRIARGDSLSAIASLHGTTVQALAAANGMRPGDVIRIGQHLVIPQPARPGGGNDWVRYARPAEKPGVLDLFTHRHRFRGQVVQKGALLAEGRRGVSALLGVKGSRPQVPDRLLRLLVRVSDTFGGRPIWVVSGYRKSSYFTDSRHKDSAAVDFSVVGVPNAVLRQYLLLFDDVGVGYYPNSSFVHLDVRGCAMQWVDYAGPGEKPRRTQFASKLAKAGSKRAKAAPKAKGTKTAKATKNALTVSDLDEIAAEIKADLEQPAVSHEAAAAASDTNEQASSPVTPSSSKDE
jgi:LysM repeat protein